MATGQIDQARRQKLEFVLEENRVYRALHRALDEYLATISTNATIRDWTMSSLSRPAYGLQEGAIHKSERLGGLLNFYHRAAA